MSRLDKLMALLESDPDDAFVLYGVAQELAKTGEHERAVEFYDRCVAADPQYCYGYYHKAVALKSLGRNDDAAEAVREGIRAAEATGDEKALGELSSLLEDLR